MALSVENREINLDNMVFNTDNVDVDVDKTDAVSEIDLDGPAIEFRDDLGGYTQEEIEALCDISEEDIVLAFGGRGVELYLGEDGDKHGDQPKELIDLSGDDDDVDMSEFTESPNPGFRGLCDLLLG